MDVENRTRSDSLKYYLFICLLYKLEEWELEIFILTFIYKALYHNKEISWELWKYKSQCVILLYHFFCIGFLLTLQFRFENQKKNENSRLKQALTKKVQKKLTKQSLSVWEAQNIWFNDFVVRNNISFSCLFPCLCYSEYTKSVVLGLISILANVKSSKKNIFKKNVFWGHSVQSLNKIPMPYIVRNFLRENDIFSVMEEFYWCKIFLVVEIYLHS